MKKIEMKVMLDPGAKVPTRAHKKDAGLDLYARESQVIPAGGSAVFDTGVHIQLPPDTVGILLSKSGLNFEHSITSDGVIDEDYIGSIKAKLYNQSEMAHGIKKGEKITQLLVLPCLRPDPVVVDTLEKTERGDKGFGSSGR